MDPDIRQSIQPKDNRTVFLQYGRLLLCDRCQIKAAHLRIGRPSLDITAGIEHTAHRVRICPCIIHILVQMSRKSFMRQRREQRQRISHMRLIDIDHIFLIAVDRRDHIKRGTQISLQRLRHILHADRGIRCRGKCLRDLFFQSIQNADRIRSVHCRRLMRLLRIPDQSRRFLGYISFLLSIAPLPHHMFHPVILRNPQHPFHGLQILHDLPLRQILHLRHRPLRSRRHLYDLLIILLSLWKITQPLVIYPRPHQRLQRRAELRIRRKHIAGEHQRISLDIDTLLLLTQPSHLPDPVHKGGDQIITLPHIHKHLALLDHLHRRSIRHEQPRIRLRLFKCDQRLKILRRHFHQFQINIHILPVIKLIFRQQYRKLRMNPADQSQRLLIQRKLRIFLQPVHIIIQHVKRKPVCNRQLLRIKFLHRAPDIFHRSQLPVLIRFKCPKRHRRFPDPKFLRIPQCIMKVDRIGSRFLTEQLIRKFFKRQVCLLRCLLLTPRQKKGDQKSD